jgi:hypothetical protein
MHPASAHRNDATDGLAAALLGLLIFLGSLLLVAIPIGWLWLLSQLGQPYLGVYFLALAGCPAAMIAWSAALLRLNRLYARLSGDGDGAKELLEASIALAVVLAVLLLAAWLILFPQGGGPVEGPWPG